MCYDYAEGPGYIGKLITRGMPENSITLIYTASIQLSGVPMEPAWSLLLKEASPFIR